jgi:hypothetical protein
MQIPYGFSHNEQGELAGNMLSPVNYKCSVSFKTAGRASEL